MAACDINSGNIKRATKKAWRRHMAASGAAAYGEAISSAKYRQLSRHKAYGEGINQRNGKVASNDISEETHYSQAFSHLKL